MVEVVVAGAGIVGLATAYELTRRGHGVTVLEKESEIAQHQTGRNSGVIHSGLYYAPGSLKARLGTAGAASMRDFAVEHGVPVEICGKLVVATKPEQLPALEKLQERGQANGVPLRRITPSEAKEFEPNVSCVAALRVETTGIVDYVGVCRTLASLIIEGGGRLVTGTEIVGIDARPGGVTVVAADGEHRADRFVNCAGLQSDRLARLAGLDPDVRIVPFRGEYFELKPAYENLVQGLIYPVPDPTLPFLGVHLTKMINGGVHAGPNAVLALAREGYSWRTVKPKDVADYLRWPGLWRLGRRYWRTGIGEVARSLSHKRFLASLRELVPELPDDSLEPAPAGVRAQALRRDGSMLDDFAYLRAPGQIHVLNAPSPAATASLEIGRTIADEVDRL
ncbi:L-2-hydroxyglutarate oxidase [Microlunatus phosphovorus]|uniref:L-2-hydroxyglutarate oxidase n=1 Tax=Microlunatus phosphovorus TaxID=29405 RepID=UPI0005A1BBB6|nr:L-2-hydroxyglutarate oxidase [Microlunatus phosphovorus]